MTNDLRPSVPLTNEAGGQAEGMALDPTEPLTKTRLAAPATATAAGWPTGSLGDAETLDLRRQVVMLAATGDLAARLEATSNLSAASQRLADLLQEHLAAKQAMVGLCRHGLPLCRLAAISQIASFDAQSSFPRAAQAVLQEAIARGELVRWPPPDVYSSGGLVAHRQFAQTNAVAAIVSGPLRDATGVLQGAWMATFVDRTTGPEPAADFLRVAETPVASALKVMARAELGPIQRAIRSAGGALRQRKGIAMVVLAIAAIAILCLPWRYDARCRCTIEPATRRFVAAPFDAPLEAALVKPGDEVAAGQLLARMDGREIRWDLAGSRADLNRAASERAGHVAMHDVGKAEAARFEVDRLAVRTELLEQRDKNLEIRSPIAGVVVSGDWQDAAGMPLEIGQTLFEIAPLDAMIVELAIPEDDFAEVRAGMSIVISLDAFPLQRLTATVERIHPRSEVRDDENVFIAEARLDNADFRLRPGMKGAAKIAGDRHAIGWILFRRPFAATIRWLGW